MSGRILHVFKPLPLIVIPHFIPHFKLHNKKRFFASGAIRIQTLTVTYPGIFADTFLTSKVIDKICNILRRSLKICKWDWPHATITAIIITSHDILIIITKSILQFFLITSNFWLIEKNLLFKLKLEHGRTCRTCV